MAIPNDCENCDMLSTNKASVFDRWLYYNMAIPIGFNNYDI
jgi:hypothetical protein